MKSIKKFMMKLMVLSLAFIFVFAIGCGGGSGENAKHNDFIDTIGGVSETYKGEFSEQEFETKEDAAEAYVMQQVVGSNDATVVNTESKGTLGGGAESVKNVYGNISRRKYLCGNLGKKLGIVSAIIRDGNTVSRSAFFVNKSSKTLGRLSHGVNVHRVHTCFHSSAETGSTEGKTRGKS